MENSKLFDKVYGCLVGGLIGDAMGAKTEGLTWQQIAEKFGYVNEFEGAGTDDSAIKQILCEAIIANDGYVTADEFATSFLNNRDKYLKLFYVPVRNMLHKVEADLVNPVDGGYCGSPSSSSAMAISPMGIINACNPAQAAIETFDVAGLIHSGPSGFCRDGACAIAAAVAEAIKENSTVDSVIEASTAYLHKTSGRVMIEGINKVLAMAKKLGNCEDFRDWFYDNWTYKVACDSRETIPAVFALFYLANGNHEQAVITAANFGRDSDTIGTMVGAVCGAFQGASAIRSDWVNKIEDAAGKVVPISKDYGIAPIILTDQRELAKKLSEIAVSKVEKARLQFAELDKIV